MDRGSQRDRLRLRATDPPGEAAAAVLIEEEAAAIARGAPVLARISVRPKAALKAASAPAHRAALGDCGAADGALALVLAIAAVLAGDGPQDIVFADPGLPPTGVSLRPA